MVIPDIGYNNLERIVLEMADRLKFLEETVGRIQAGNTVVTLDGSSQGVILWPTPYLAAPIVVMTGGNLESLTYQYSGVGPLANGTGVSFYAYTQAGVQLGPGANVRVYWIAIPQNS